MSRIDPTVLAILAQIMRVAASAISMTSSSAMLAVPNAVTGCHIVAFLTAPVALSLDWMRDLFIDRSLGLANGTFAEGRRGRIEVVLDATIEMGMGIGIGEVIGATVEGLLLELEGLTECSDAASLA